MIVNSWNHLVPCEAMPVYFVIPRYELPHEHQRFLVIVMNAGVNDQRQTVLDPDLSLASKHFFLNLQTDVISVEIKNEESDHVHYFSEVISEAYPQNLQRRLHRAFKRSLLF